MQPTSKVALKPMPRTTRGVPISDAYSRWTAIFFIIDAFTENASVLFHLTYRSFIGKKIKREQNIVKNENDTRSNFRDVYFSRKFLVLRNVKKEYNIKSWLSLIIIDQFLYVLNFTATAIIKKLKLGIIYLAFSII